MRAGADVDLKYTYMGSSYSYKTLVGYKTDTSYVLSYSFSGENISYSLDITVYLDCTDAEFFFYAYSAEYSVRPGESTEITAFFQCGFEDIPNRLVDFTVTGDGTISSTSARTDKEGQASITFTANSDASYGEATVTAKIEGCSCADQPSIEEVLSIYIVDYPKLTVTTDKTSVNHFEPLYVTVKCVDGVNPIPGVEISYYIDIWPEIPEEDTDMHINYFPDMHETDAFTDADGEYHFAVYTAKNEGNIIFNVTAFKDDYFNNADGYNELWLDARSEGISVNAIYELWTATGTVNGWSSAMIFSVAYTSTFDVSFIRTSNYPHILNGIGTVSTSGVKGTWAPYWIEQGLYFSDERGGDSVATNVHFSCEIETDEETGAMHFLESSDYEYFQSGGGITVEPYIFEVEYPSGDDVKTDVRYGLSFGGSNNDGTPLIIKEGTFSGFTDNFLDTYDWTITFTKSEEGVIR